VADANDKPLRLSCVGCSSTFLRALGKRGPLQKYCTARCRERAHVLKQRASGYVPPREQRNKCADCGVRVGPTSVRCPACLGRSRVAESSRFYCEHCGRSSNRRVSGSNKASGIVNRWCSMDCRKAQSAHLQDELAALGRIGQRARARPGAGFCLVCGQACKALNMATCSEKCRAQYNRTTAIQSYKAKNAHIWSVPRQCVVCGSVFHKAYGQSASRSWCSDTCREDQIRQSKRASRGRRRARKRGALSESINPTRVFERDDWRCHLCGRKTPKALRGTYDGRAPELDHLIPLGAGGSHTWANVACSCRACNGAKGARPIGQLLLDAFAVA
jgi:predicted nucleic acid-binding Zn ribbon protein